MRRGHGLALDLDERHDARLELRARASRSGSPFAPLPKRKFSPTETCVAPSCSISTSWTNSSADFDGEVAVERDRDELVHAEPGDQVALDRGRVEQLRQRLRRDDAERMRVEREHRVAAPDYLAVAEVDAVERPDRDLARARLGVRQRRDLHGANTTSGWISPSRGRPIASSSPPPSGASGRRSGRRRDGRARRRRPRPRPARARAGTRARRRAGRSAPGRRPRAGTGRSPSARAARSRRRRAPRRAGGRRCRPSTRSRTPRARRRARAARPGTRSPARSASSGASPSRASS